MYIKFAWQLPLKENVNQVDDITVLQLSNYNKGDRDSISDKEIKELVQRFG